MPDLIIIGGGPGGYVCAIRAAQLGLDPVLIEMRQHLGGTCLNVGCIPSKALLHSSELYQQVAHGAAHGIVAGDLRLDLDRMLRRKDAVVDQLRRGIRTLVDKRKITVRQGRGSLAGAGKVKLTTDAGEEILQARHIVLATGSMPMQLPFLPFTGERVVSSDQAIAFAAVPKSLLVIGAGAIGLELGSVWSRLGSEVTILEFLPTIAGGVDPDVSRTAERIFKKQGLRILTRTKVTGAQASDSGVTLTAEQGGKSVEFSAERVLVAVGRKPYTEGLDLEQAGLNTDARGRVPVRDLRTGVDGIWAIGDLVEGPMLAHKAEEDGCAVAEMIAGHPAHIDYGLVPGVIYTQPEIALVGIGEQTAAERGLEVRTGTFPLQANGRAIAQGAAEGMVKIVADARNDRVLGAAVIAPGASEIIASIVAHMTYGGSAEDIGRTIHAHPTVAESVKEAALAVAGIPIHSL
jgi:dihydrolipoamide dehydrogenase